MLYIKGKRIIIIDKFDKEQKIRLVAMLKMAYRESIPRMSDAQAAKIINEIISHLKYCNAYIDSDDEERVKLIIKRMSFKLAITTDKKVIAEEIAAIDRRVLDEEVAVVDYECLDEESLLLPAPPTDEQPEQDCSHCCLVL